MLTLLTSRLTLVPSTLELLDAELASPLVFAALLGAQVPDDWPPGEYDRSAIEHFRSCLVENPEHAAWYGWYALLRSGTSKPATLIGAGGFLGPPDSNGVVEIGYSFVPRFRGKGYATELVHSLVNHAFETGRVHRIIAHTTMDNVGSVRVLEKVGFLPVGSDGECDTTEYVLPKERGAS